MWRRTIASIAGAGACTLRVITTTLGAPKRGNRFAQASGRQGHSPTERIGGVHKHNVGVARQIQMLKTIIQHEPIGSMPREDFAILVSISADADFNLPGKPLPKKRDFIALRLRRAHPHPRFRDIRASKLPPASLPRRAALQSTTPSESCPSRRP